MHLSKFEQISSYVLIILYSHKNLKQIFNENDLYS